MYCEAYTTCLCNTYENLMENKEGREMTFAAERSFMLSESIQC